MRFRAITTRLAGLRCDANQRKPCGYLLKKREAKKGCDTNLQTKTRSDPAFCLSTNKKHVVVAGLRLQQRELRIQHDGGPYRVLYVFDPRRVALLLLGGDKTGDDRWYEKNVPLADRIYDQYLRELKEEGDAETD